MDKLTKVHQGKRPEYLVTESGRKMRIQGFCFPPSDEIKDTAFNQALVAHAYNPSYLGS
jgi:hypothetical protein